MVEQEEQVFEKRHIETGMSDGVNIQVLTGLNAEDKIQAGKKKVNKVNKKSS